MTARMQAFALAMSFALVADHALVSVTRGAVARAVVTAAPDIAVLQLSANEVVGGTAVQLLVRLDANAVLAGESVALTYAPASLLSAPPRGVLVPSGSREATTTLTTVPTGTTTPVTITATVGASTRTVTLTVRRPQMASVTAARATVGSGDTIRVSMMLDGVAPAGGIQPIITFTPPIDLVHIIPTPADLTPFFSIGNFPIGGPDSTSIAAGSRVRTFLLAARPVSTARTITVNASAGVSQTASFQIIPPRITSIAVHTTCPSSEPPGSGGVSGPRTYRGRVSTPDGMPDTPVQVALTSSSPSVSVPATVELIKQSPTFRISGNTIVLSGPRGDACFDVKVDPVNVAIPVTLTATIGEAKATLTFTNNPVSISQLVIPQELVVSGAQVNIGVVINTPAGPGGVKVSLASSSAAIMTVPPTVTVPEGALSTQFTATAVVPAGHPDVATGVIVTATFNGLAKADTLIVRR